MQPSLVHHLEYITLICAPSYWNLLYTVPGVNPICIIKHNIRYWMSPPFPLPLDSCGLFCFIFRISIHAYQSAYHSIPIKWNVPWNCLKSFDVSLWSKSISLCVSRCNIDINKVIYIPNHSWIMNKHECWNSLYMGSTSAIPCPCLLLLNIVNNLALRWHIIAIFLKKMLKRNDELQVLHCLSNIFFMTTKPCNDGTTFQLPNVSIKTVHSDPSFEDRSVMFISGLT